MIDLSLTRTIRSYDDFQRAISALFFHARTRNITIIRKVGRVWHIANPGRPVTPCDSWHTARRAIKGPRQ